MYIYIVVVPRSGNKGDLISPPVASVWGSDSNMLYARLRSLWPGAVA